MSTSPPGLSPPPPPPRLLQQPLESPSPSFTSNPPSSLAPTMPPADADPAAAAAERRVKLLTNNNCRLESVVRRIEQHFSVELSSPPPDLGHLVFSLARGIDFALSYNDIPALANRLPSLIKQVYRFRNDASLQPSMMVLLIAVKNACAYKWFPAADANELLSKTNELSSSFCISTTGTYFGNAQDTISKIMPRFYPQLHFHRLIFSLEAKTGYDILMGDFHIQRNYPPKEKICLLVVQTDNLEMSSCITNPQHVNILINGKAVERRTNVSMDRGPQFPSDITKMLKFGTNIIQAIGYFNGPCIIAIAFMSKIANPCSAILEDYVHQVPEYLELDSEVIEGPSRIALNCPISFKRIRIPVKGHNCKHYQCFDYENYMEMNSWKPSWRCPCCNTPTNHIDLRIDQKIAKILQEVGEDVCDIVIFADGSWKFFEHNECMQETITEEVRGASADVMDLNMDENYIWDTKKNAEVLPSCRTADAAGNNSCNLEDRKTIMESEGIHMPLYASEVSSVSTVSTQAVSFHAENDFWSGNLSWTPCSVSTTSVCANTTTVGTLESLVPSVVLAPLQTNAVSPVHNQGNSSIELPQTTANFQQASVAPSVALNPVQNNAGFPAPSQGSKGLQHSTAVNFQQVPFVPNAMLNPIQTEADSSVLSPVPAVSEVPHSTVNFQQRPVVPSIILNPKTDAFSPSLNQAPTGSVIPQITADLQLMPQVTHKAENMQLQPMRVRGSPTTNEARRPPVPRNATRVPLTLQALPAQTRVQRSAERMQTAMAAEHGSVNGQVQIDEHWKPSDVTSATIPPNSIAQEQHRHANASLQHAMGVSTPNITGSREPGGQPRGVGAYRTTAPYPPFYQQCHHHLSQRTHYTSPSTAPRAPHSTSTQVLQASHSPGYAAAEAAMISHLNAQRAAQATTSHAEAARTPSSVRVPAFNKAGGTMPSSGPDMLAEPRNDQGWRPLGRMRGSLSGSAYQAALSRYTNPTMQSQVPPFSANAPPSQLPMSASSGVAHDSTYVYPRFS